jgi:hypothetical protein
MNPSDPRTPTSIVKHTSRGTRSLLLLSEAFRANPSAMIDTDPTMQELDLLVNQVFSSSKNEESNDREGFFWVEFRCRCQQEFGQSITVL